ncbi:MAG: sodium-dependent transporter [Succinivibrionaceae bacterium]|nr:sodium-dependent transporter [Succinivibrionaceae bacterium]
MRANFSSKIGLTLAAAGSAIGLGNIWRFPTQAGENGGSAFLLVYFACIVLFGLPLVIAEFSIGRHARANPADAFKILSPGTQWKWLGALCVLIPALILCYYQVVAGWTLFYLCESLTGGFEFLRSQAADNPKVFAEHFGGFVSDPLRPLVFLGLFAMATHVVIVRGVQRGIEAVSKFLMPLLFIIMVVLVICSFSMPGFSEGMRFLFTPDFSAINTSVVLSALAQCFFSFSIAMGILLTYSSYFLKSANLTRTALSVCIMDTLAAIMAGMVIFPAVFSVPGLEPNSGATLVFVALPSVFDQALAGMPFLAYLVPVLFYLLLVIATLTSSVSIHEVVTAYASETFGITRARAATYVTVLATAVGIICSLSMGVLDWVKIGGMNIFDCFDYTTAQLMLPFAGMLIAIYVGWKMRLRQLWVELTSGGLYRFPLFVPFMVIMRYIAPITIFFILISQLGFF